jgi:hypothetical protein
MIPKSVQRFSEKIMLKPKKLAWRAPRCVLPVKVARFRDRP